MRVLVIFAAIALSLPGVSTAQRLPPRSTPEGLRRPEPAPLPRQPGPIARAEAYKRQRLASETYPMVTYFRAPGLTGGARAAWTSFGTGTHADYLLSRLASATLDVTSSYVGGPATTQTVEIGTRLRPDLSHTRWYPYVDLRAGYMAVWNKLWNWPGLDQTQGPYGHYNYGFGGLAGVGMEYSLTHSWSVTSAGAIMHNRMTTSAFEGSRAYPLTMYRFTLGLRYNPVRLAREPGVPPAHP